MLALYAYRLRGSPHSRVLVTGKQSINFTGIRALVTLAIETSCDDTSIAILEKHDGYPSLVRDHPVATLHFHEKITADNGKFAGVHPIIAQDSHQRNLATLLAKALPSLPPIPERLKKGNQGCGIQVHSHGSFSLKRKPDFISVTRGPGLRSCLATGLDTAKGLAVAWQVPLLGLHHMSAHALTPRLISALKHGANNDADPPFPFLSLLVSGGHTLLAYSKSITDHEIVAKTSDIAIGDCIDKIARAVLPSSLLSQSSDAMYGRLLESFAFPSGPEFYNYTPPANRHEELVRKPSKWAWSIGTPLSETRAGKSRSLEFTFTGTQGNVERICQRGWQGENGGEERVALAREAMRVLFEHLSSRVVMAIEQLQGRGEEVATLIVSGGVASNGFLGHILRRFLDARGLSRVRCLSPPGALCTDNAAMIAWNGIEMYEAGWVSDLSIQALRKWAIDARATDGGILGADGWKRRHERGASRDAKI